MIKRVILAAVILLTFSVFSFGAFSQSFSDYGKIDERVAAELGSRGTAKVIVYYTEGGEEIISEYGIEGRKFIYSDAFHALLDGEQIEALAGDERVLKIGHDYELQVMLSDSAPLVNATLTWDLQGDGLNLTGAGQTICVIDTGIDYTHPDLGGCTTGTFLAGTCEKVIGGYDFVNGDNDPMDDHSGSHGTHVAGIAAANGDIKGIAPDAKLVAIKAASSSGGGNLSNAVDGIEWCTSNSSIFNISVITISLGTNASAPGNGFDSYCDGSDSSTTNAINAAFAKNISVTVATANNANYTHISLPSCVVNATRVTSSSKSDVISSFANRNSLVNLIAPGELITSTIRVSSGSYGVKSGTSMATPHVAGAIAIINQYLSQTGRTMTPLEIEHLLNSTGKLIYDSLSDNNYSRFDLYSAVVSIDEFVPGVSLSSPSDGASTIPHEVNFTCGASDLSLKNVTLNLWNSTSLYNFSFSEISGSGANKTFGVNLTELGNYEWNCEFTDENGNFAGQDQNYTLVVSEITSTLIAPQNNSFVNSATDFECFSESLSELTNATFFLWNATGSLVHTNLSELTGNTNSTSFYFNFSEEGTYEWNCEFGSQEGDFSKHQNNYTITYEIDSPEVNLLSPGDGFSATGTTEVEFVYNFTDELDVVSCALILNGNGVSVNSSALVDDDNSIDYTLTAGSYEWNIECTDAAGNNGTALEGRSILINSVSSGSDSGGGGSGSGGGGGGGGGSGGGGLATASTADGSDFDDGASYTTNELKKGVSAKVSEGGQIEIFLKDGMHTITIVELVGDGVRILLKSHPQYIDLASGKTELVDVDHDGSADIAITIVSFVDGGVELKIWDITESSLEEAPENSPSLDETKDDISIYLTAGAIIILAVFALIYCVVKSRRESKAVRKESLVSKLR